MSEGFENPVPVKVKCLNLENTDLIETNLRLDSPKEVSKVFGEQNYNLALAGGTGS